MKIAHLVSTFPPYRGGIGNIACHYARELELLGHDIEVFTPNYDEGDKSLDKKNNIEATQANLDKIFEIAEKNTKVNPRNVIKAANLSANLYLKDEKLDDAAKKYSFNLDQMLSAFFNSPFLK